MKDRLPKIENLWAGCDSVPAVFAFSVRHALPSLTGEDLASISRTTSVPSLGWLRADRHAALASYFDVLAHRGANQRYRIRQPDRLQLLEILGTSALYDARVLFVLAWSIDDAFSSVMNDAPAEAAVANLMFPGGGYFADIPNAAPPLGQMTATAILRTHFRNFWYVGPLSKFDTFGPLPTPRSRALPKRLEQRLQSALEEELRVAAVTWRPHSDGDLQMLHPAPGLFAVTGYSSPVTADLIDRVLEELWARRIHVVVLHEIGTTGIELDLLVQALKRHDRAYPTLIAVGLVHEANGSGKYSNRAVLLGSDGATLLDHEKLEPFTDPEAGMEAIIPRDSRFYEYIDTPLGRVVVNICKDIRSDVPALLNRVLGVAAVLVPSYSKGLDYAVEEARVLGARQRAMAVVANAYRSNYQQMAAMYFPVRGQKESERRVPQQTGGDRSVICTVSVSRDGAGKVVISDPVLTGVP